MRIVTFVLMLIFICCNILEPLYANTTYPTGYLPIEIKNDTTLSDNKLYVVIKASDIVTGRDCFIAVDAHTGMGVCTYVDRNTITSNFSYPLSKLPLSTDNSKRVVLIPKVASGRIYFSAGYPLDLIIAKATNRIIDPDGFKPRDSNYYTLYDKIEFTYNNSGSWVNATAVDFFSLPIHITQLSSSSGVTEAGISARRTSVIQKVKNIFKLNDKTDNKIWNNLFLYYSDSLLHQNVNLRIAAPAKAMMTTLANTQPFDPNYLSNPAVYGFDFVKYLWDYYATNTMVIDAREIAIFFPLDNYIFTGRMIADQLVFTNQTGTYTQVINKPANSAPFFAGAGDSFDATNNTPKAIIIRQLTSAFDAGLLPAKNGTMIDKAFFTSNKSLFYTVNPLLPLVKQGPWYDLYSKALHSFGINQTIYTFAYDDALGQDGTLHDPHAGMVTVALKSLQGVPIPNPYYDPAIYTVTPLIGSGSTVLYQGKILQNNVPIQNVKIPFQVTLNGHDANIYFRYPLVKPNFEEADGIVIIPKGNGQVQVIFPGH